MALNNADGIRDAVKDAQASRSYVSVSKIIKEQLSERPDCEAPQRSNIYFNRGSSIAQHSKSSSSQGSLSNPTKKDELPPS